MADQNECIKIDVSVKKEPLDNIGIFEFMRRTNLINLYEYHKRKKRKRRYGYYVMVSSIH